MSHEITIPPFGESVTSALVAQWHFKTGDQVRKGDSLVSLESDKVSNELEAEVSGVLSIEVSEGEEVPIGTVIGRLEQSVQVSNERPFAEPLDSDGSSSEDEVDRCDEGGEVREIVVPAAGESITSATVATWNVGDGAFVRQGEILVSLETDKVSQEVEAEVSGHVSIQVQEGEEVKIGSVLGTITTAQDQAPVKVAVAETSSPSQLASSVETKSEWQTSPSQSQKPDGKSAPIAEGRVTRQKMSPLRRKIATHLVNAQQTAAILTTFNEVDMTEVMALRHAVQEEFVAKHGVKLGFMSLFAKAVVQALKDVPAINARIEEHEIIENHFYDLGIAIGTEKGLLVPVVRDADAKSFAEIEKDIINYALKAKEGKIELSDLTGGVFTISNGGVYGSLLSTPILNPPQSGILGMHSIQQRPVAINGKVEIRPMMYLALSYDHRLVDGKEAVTFLIRIKECLENPARMMLEM